MRSYVTPVCAFILIIGTFAGGWLHGGLTSDAGLQTAAAQLNEPFPKVVGNWKQSGDDLELNQDVRQVLQCKGNIYRKYKHNDTGETLVVALLLGPAGPISVHTPEVCYSSRDYDTSKKRKKTTITLPSGEEHDFWEVFAKSKHIELPSQRVLYAWTTGTTWEAANRPRFAYAGARHLYKLQIAAPIQDDSAKEDFDPCQDFLSEFLALVQTRLIEAKASSR